MADVPESTPKSPPKKEEFFAPERVAEVLQEVNGNASAAARVLGCHPQTVRAYCKRYPEVQAARDEGEERMLDTAEASLVNCIERGDGWAVCFSLKTKGAKRGYIERQHHELSGEIAITEKPGTVEDAKALLAKAGVEL
jgi:hypothetical protein